MFIAHYENVTVTHHMSYMSDANSGLHEQSPGLEFDCWAPDPTELECSQCGESYSKEEVVEYSNKYDQLYKRRTAYALKTTKTAKAKRKKAKSAKPKRVSRHKRN